MGTKKMAYAGLPKGKQACLHKKWRPQGDLNPRRRREKAVSWARLDDGDVSFSKLDFQKKMSSPGFEPGTRTLKVCCSTS